MRRANERGEIALILVILAVVVALLFGGYKVVGVAADALAAKVPDRIEREVFGGLGSRQPGWQVANSPDHHRAQAVFDRLIKAKGLRELDYRLYFLQDATPNAFALPGGAVAVTDGLLEMVEGEIGLATVVAHELGHQQHRHSLAMMGRSLLVAGVLMFVVGDAGLLFGLALDLAEKSHSRAQELEADAYGINMVHQAYGTTDGALEFFEKLDTASQADTATAQMLAMMSTHPYTPDRIQALRRQAEALEKQTER